MQPRSSSLPVDPTPCRARLIGGALIELQRGCDVCLVNVDWSPDRRHHRVYASEAESPWFPDLAMQLRELLPQLPGRFEIV